MAFAQTDYPLKEFGNDEPAYALESPKINPRPLPLCGKLMDKMLHLMDAHRSKSPSPPAPLLFFFDSRNWRDVCTFVVVTY